MKNDLTVLPNPGIMVYKRNHPKMAELCNSVKYYNLPSHMFMVQIPFELLSSTMTRGANGALHGANFSQVPPPAM